MSLEQIIDALDLIDSTSNQSSASTPFLEVKKAGECGEEVTVRGNREGLIYLGLKCLELAQHRLPGAHYHFDKASIPGDADLSLVIAYRDAPWEAI